jgi:hypothetical protein
VLGKNSGGSARGLLDLGGLVLGTDATRAGLDPLTLSVYHHCRAMHIGQPTSVRSPFRMANIVAGASDFTAYLTTRHILPFYNGVSLG